MTLGVKDRAAIELQMKGKFNVLQSAGDRREGVGLSGQSKIRCLGKRWFVTNLNCSFTSKHAIDTNSLGNLLQEPHHRTTSVNQSCCHDVAMIIHLLICNVINT